MNKRRIVARIVASALLCLLVVGVGQPAAATQFPPAQDQRVVLALYYPWYGESSWDDPVLSDRPAIPYNGWDPEAIGRHVGWARGAGIDVLVSAWFGNQVANGTEPNFRTLLDEAGDS